MTAKITEPSKRRSVVSYANLSAELLGILKEKYPRGYADYMDEIMKVYKPDGTFFHAIKLESPDAIYLVKVDVKIDDYAEVEKDMFGDGVATGSGEDDEFPEGGDEAAAGYEDEGDEEGNRGGDDD